MYEWLYIAAESSVLSEDNSSTSPTATPDPDSSSGPPATGSTALVGGGGFAVDWVVYLRVQPSLVRFTCLPVSRVQCLLRLPSLDVTFSTKRDEMQSQPPSAGGSDATPPQKTKCELLGDLFYHDQLEGHPQGQVLNLHRISPK